MVWNDLNMFKTSSFCLRKYNHVIRVQSSIKVINHRVFDIVEIREGPHKSKCIKGTWLLLVLNGFGTQWLLAKMHVLHLRLQSDTFKNNSGNKCFM